MSASRRRLAWALVALPPLLTAACDRSGRERATQVELPVVSDTGVVRPPGVPAVAALPARPDSLLEVRVREGKRRRATLRLYRSPAEFLLPFTVYLPEGVEPRLEAAESLELGPPEEDGSDARIAVLVLPEGITAAEARSRALERIERMGGWATRTPDGGGGSVAHWRYLGPGLVGSLSLGRHGERFFFLDVRYRPGRDDGFAPDAARVRDTWRWSDDGRPLG